MQSTGFSEQPFRTWRRASIPAWVICGAAIFCADAAASAAEIERLANGSFEAGEAGPSAWRLDRGALWGTQGAHSGGHFVQAQSRQAAPLVESDSFALEAGDGARLEGWIRCRAGQAQVGIDLLDASGAKLAEQLSPPVTAGREWEYVACEFSLSGATHSRVWFRVQGLADLDDVRVTPLAADYIGNPGLEKDDRGRIPFWGEEKADGILPGRRGGQFQPDATSRREGPGSALLTATNDWFGLASVNYPTAGWTESYEVSAWAKCDAGASARIVACWTDDLQTTITNEAGPLVSGGDWQSLSLRAQAPPRAAALRLVLVAQRGRVWFDDCRLARLAPKEPRVSIFVNQVGYDRQGPKSAVVAANLFPAASGAIEFEVVDAKNRRALKKKERSAGRVLSGTTNDWGWYFWRADFSDLRQAGQFRLKVKIGETQAESLPFLIGHGQPLAATAREAVDFFFVQRCGFEVPGWHKACHLDDAKLADGSMLDVTGGWHSAGDYNKLMYEHGDGGVAFALLDAARAAPELFGAWDRNGDRLTDILDEANWGAQFVARMQIPETGGLRNHVQQGPGRNWTKWAAPDLHTDNIKGTEDDPVIQAGEGNSPLVIGAWAELAKIMESQGQTNAYLESALRLWSYSTKGGTNVGGPHLLLSTLELYRRTNQPALLEHARRTAEHLLAGQNNDGPRRGAFGAYGELEAAALAAFGLACPKDALRPKITQALRAYIDFCVSTADNPFGLSKRVVGEGEHFFPPDLGHNFQLLGRSWAASLAFRVTRDRRALVYAADHVDWVLGKNPINLCMFEGKGSVNPPRYHHRYNAIPGQERGAVPGTIPNGFVRDMGLADRPGFDLSRGGNRSPSFRTSEPWLVHNLFYLLAASELYRISEGRE